MTQELLQLLWVVEATVSSEAELNATVEAVLGGPLFAASDLPQPLEHERRSPVDDQDDDFQTNLSLE